MAGEEEEEERVGKMKKRKCLYLYVFCMHRFLESCGGALCLKSTFDNGLTELKMFLNIWLLTNFSDFFYFYF